MERYKSSNKIGKAGVPLLMSAAAIGGVAIGSIASIAASFFYLIILFPIIMGGIGKVVLSLAIKRGKVRNPLVAGAFGMLMGGIIAGTLHLGEYIQFHQAASDEMKKELGSIQQQEIDRDIDALINQYLENKTGARGFWGYIKYSAQQGVSIGKIGQEGANLGETGTWIYWICELLVIQGIIAYAAYRAASEPFSESANQWYENPVGIESVNSNKDLVELLQNNRFLEAGKLIDPLEIKFYPYMQIFTQTCPGDRNLILGVNTIALDKKGKLTTAENVRGVIPQASYQKFQNGIAETRSHLGAGVTDEQILAALHERQPPFNASDRFEPHQLKPAKEANLVKQLAQIKKIKEAYLVRKTLKNFPEKPLYLLGIVRAKGLIESKDAESKLMEALKSQLDLPHQTQILILNQNKELLSTLARVQPKPIYKA